LHKLPTAEPRCGRPVRRSSIIIQAWFIRTPVLIIAGRQDPIVPPANGQLLADHLPNSRYTLLEGGHLIWEDAAAAYAFNVTEWINGGYQAA
jgi:pimeloyl-ACP methyl ester carboxylesterase